MEIYILCIDSDGTFHSHPEPIGVAVLTEIEAKLWVERSTLGYSRSYEKIKIVGLEGELRDERSRESGS